MSTVRIWVIHFIITSNWACWPGCLYPQFILHGLPIGISGLLVAGILDAAMGSLSAALNAMSNSTVSDIIRNFSCRTLSDATMLKLARIMTLVWAALMAVFACAFSGSTGNVYLTGLAIAGYTYGALLGAFLLGRLVRRATGRDALVAFISTIAVMAYIVGWIKIPVPAAGTTMHLSLAPQWLVQIGVLVTLTVGGLLSLRHSAPAHAPSSVEMALPAMADAPAC